MNRRALLLVASVAAAIGGATALSLVGDESPVQNGDVALHPDRAEDLPDGGLGYAVDVRTADGGTATRMIASPACVRRPVGTIAALCMRNDPFRGLYNQGALRFPATQAVGAGCQPVACSIPEESFLSDGGDPAAEEEMDAVKRRSGARGARP